MSNRVYTYAGIKELRNAPYLKEIALLPQITMSIEMERALSKSVFAKNVISFQKFQELLFAGWNTGAQRFRFVAVLNRLLREKMSRVKSKAELDWLTGCKKNIFAAVTNIIKLEEAAVHPDDVMADDRDMVLFLEMWRYLVKQDRSISDFRRQRTEYEDTKVFSKKIDDTFKDTSKRKIVWNGFQYHTPMQQFLFERFMNSGFEIYALIQDDERYPYANEIWNHLYNGENGFPIKDDWIRQEHSAAKNPLGEIFESGEMTEAPGVRIMQYENTMEFIEDIDRIKFQDKYYLYAADDRSANAMLKDYFPKCYGLRNLLAYPIGQFIYTLHTMWDENLQQITLEPDDLRKCFSSGWLTSNGKSGIRYTDDLERMLPYFEGCHTIDDWNERLDRFYAAYDDAVSIFTTESTDDSVADIRRDIMGNPFRHFSAFSMKQEDIESVLDMVKQLIEMTKTLFGENKPVSIREHMAKLDTLLAMREDMIQDVYLEEKKVARELLHIIEDNQPEDYHFYPGDLASALISFIQNNMEEDEAQKGRLKSLVFNIFQIEAAPAASKGKVHICMADIGRLPGPAGRLLWPLDENLLRQIVSDSGNKYLGLWVEDNHLTHLANRNYIYNAFNNPDVEISWIRKQGDKVLSPSPYITLLERLTDLKIERSVTRDLTMDKVAGIYAHQRFNREYDIRDNANMHSYDSELEYALCPMRFVYSNVLGNRPTYANEYLQNRAIVRMIQILYRLLGKEYDVNEVANQVLELFPNIRKAEKRQLLDDAKRWWIPKPEIDYTVFDGKKYTDWRLNLTFTDEKSYEQARSLAAKLMSQEGRRDISYEQKGESGSHNCEFCPHARYCRRAIFGVDYKEEL